MAKHRHWRFSLPFLFTTRPDLSETAIRSTMTAKGKKPDAKELAERLRANLKRRKQQARARRIEKNEEGESPPRQ